MRVLWFYGLTPNKLGGLELFAARMAELYPMHQFTAGFDSSPTPAVAAYLRDKVNVIAVAGQASFHPKAIAQTASHLQDLRPDVVVYTLGGIVRPLPWLGRLAGARVVYMDETSRTVDFVASGLKGAVLRFLVRPVSLVIAASEYTRQAGRRENLSRCPTITIPNAVRTNQPHTSGVEFRRRFNIPLDATVVTQCSSLIHEKGVDLLLEAAARLSRSRVHVVLSGEGKERATFEDMARGLPVTFTGQLVDPVTEGLYAASDIFCLPSRWQESCGLVNLEAMASGLAVIASRIGGIPEFVVDGECGLLIEPTVADLTEKLRFLLDNPGLRRALGENGRRRVHQRFSLDGMVHAYARALGLGETEQLRQQTFEQTSFANR